MQRIKCFLEWTRRTFFAIFKIPENMLFFLSGIVLSAAINVATNGVTHNGFDWDYDCRVTISILLMFISSIFFTWMAIYIKPLEEKYKAKHPIGLREENKDKWYDVVAAKKGAVWILIIFFLLTYITLAISVLLLFGDNLEVLWQNILSQKVLVIQTIS